MAGVFEGMLQEMEAQRDAVLATVVASAGSTPRKASTQMLVGADGRLAGTIGGGNIEYRCEQTARELISRGESRLQSFNLNEKDQTGLGMTCGGDVDVWLQHVPHGSAVWRRVAQLLAGEAEGRGGWLVLDLDGGEPCLLSSRKEPLAGAAPENAGALCLPECAREGGLFAMPLPRRERAIVFGGGHVAQALVPVLASVDFETVVFESRPEFARAELFPCAKRIILGDYQAISDSLELRPDDFTVVMTHSHAHDYEVTAQLAGLDLAYRATIGSARKTRLFHEQLRAQGVPEEKIAALHMPVGLPIAADTPAEIAVSIVAEMVKVRAEQRG